MRVIVCGGRDYRNSDAIRERLRQLQAVKPMVVLISRQGISQEHWVTGLRRTQQIGLDTGRLLAPFETRRCSPPEQILYDRLFRRERQPRPDQSS